eukprot:jgi/Tetstr1/457778/TSEL_044323.t1
MRPWNKERRQHRARATLPNTHAARAGAAAKPVGAGAGNDGHPEAHQNAEEEASSNIYVTAMELDSHADHLPPLVNKPEEATLGDGRMRGESISGISLADGILGSPREELAMHAVVSSSASWAAQQQIVLKPMKMQPSAASKRMPVVSRSVDTPEVLYKNQFTLRAGALQEAMEMSNYRKEFPQPNLNQSPPREWQHLQLRMPGDIRAHDVPPINETAALIVGKDARLVQDGARGVLMEICTASDKPTSRLQAELLVNWYEAQKSKLITRGKERQPLLLDEHGVPVLGRKVIHQGSSGDATVEMMDKLIGNWDAESEPFLFQDFMEVTVEGTTLPNDRRFHRTLKQTNAVAAAATIHQVAMHCRERGAMLAAVWNTQLALTDMDQQQLKMQMSEQAAVQERLQAQLDKVRTKAMQIDAMEARVKQAEAAEQKAKEEANMFMLRTRKEREELKAIKLRGGTKTEQEEAKEEIAYLKAELLETERQRDVSLTTLYTALDITRSTTRHVLALRDREEQRAMRIRNGEEEGGEAVAEDNAARLEEIQAALEKASGLEETVEKQLTRNISKRHQAEFSTVVEAAKHAGKKMSSMIGGNMEGSVAGSEVRGAVGFGSEYAVDADLSGGESGGGGSDGDGDDSEAEADKASMRRSGSLSTSRSSKSVKFGTGSEGEEGEDPDGDEATREERLRALEMAKSVILDMSDLDDMKRDELIVEVTGLRQREHYMLTALKSFRVKEERIRQGIAELDDPNKTPAAKGKLVVAMLRAVVQSKENELRRKHEQETAQLRQRVKKQGQAKARETARAKDRWQAELEAQQAQWLMAVALMRMQYKSLWDLYMQHCGAKSEAPEKDGLPPPPTFGQFFLQFLDQGFEAAARKKRDSGLLPDDTQFRSVGQHTTSARAPSLGGQRRAWGGGGSGGGGGGGGGIGAQERSGRHRKSGRNLLKQTRQMAGMHQLAEFTKRFSMKRLGMEAQEEYASSKPDASWSGGGGAGWGEFAPGSHARRSGARASDIARSPSPYDLDGRAGPGGAAHHAVAKRARFRCKDSTLREALYKFQDTPSRSVEWATKIIDAIYKNIQSQEAKGKRDAVENMPAMLMSHFTSQYGARNLVQEYASAMVATLRKYSKEHIRLEIFSNFLSEDWDLSVLALFLEGMRLVETRGSMDLVCVEYPPDRDLRRKNPWICTRKAVMVSERLLGKRHPECAAGFTVALMKNAVPAHPEETAMHLTSPYPLEEDSVAQEEELGGPFKRIRMFDFLRALAKEADRLQGAVRDALPQLFRQWDTDNDGMMRREDLLAMYSAIVESFELDEVAAGMEEAEELWSSCLRIETTEAENQGNEPPEDCIGLTAFREACIRNQLVRDHLRMLYALPPPPEVNEEQAETQSKILYLLADRNWKDFADVVERILKVHGGSIGADESLLKGMMAKLASPHTDGRAKARLLVAMLKLLMDVQIQQMRALTDPDLHRNFELEGFLERTQRAVRVMYGWGAMLEDDDQLFERMLDPTMPLIQRSKAVRQWNASAKLFAVYKKKMEAHAANLLKIQFASMWLARNKNADANLSRRFKVNFSSVGLAANVLRTAGGRLPIAGAAGQPAGSKRPRFAPG